jgi:hypothetical protein
MTSPLTFSLPDMNSLCAFAFPLTSLPKSSSDRDRVTTKVHVSADVPNQESCAVELMFEGTNTASHVSQLPETTIYSEDVLPVGFEPNPFPTSPFSLRSMCQLSVSPALFLSVNAKTAPPCFTASFRSASEAVSALLMASNASEDGNASVRKVRSWI